MQEKKIDFVIIGHIAFNRDVTISGDKTSVGGAAYYAGVGAHIACPQGVGLMACVGEDFDLDKISKLDLDKKGISICEGRTARFTVFQSEDGTRAFTADWGVSTTLPFHYFPKEYKNAKYIHLATAPPDQQLRWMAWLRLNSPESLISVDTFEQFAAEQREETLSVLNEADIIFTNREEKSLLNLNFENYKSKVIIHKMGKDGAELITEIDYIYVEVPKVIAVETTGAGDILAGAFLSQLKDGISKHSALKMAVGLASNSVSKFGVEHLLSEKHEKDSNSFVTVRK